MLREIHKGSGDALVIHIQDAHTNLSGQENLSATLDDITKKYGISTILVEGSSKDSTLDRIRELAPSKIVLQRAAKNFLIQGKISGEEYLNLTSERPMKILGVEDRALYMESIAHYAELAHKRSETLQYLATVRIAVEKLKRKLYPKRLLEYEKTKSDKNLEALFVLADTVNKDLSDFSAIQEFRQIRDSENKIDFQLASLEQAALFEEIYKQAPEEAHHLTSLGKDIGAKLSLFNLFQKTLHIASKKNIDVTRYPNWLAYGKNLETFSKMDLEGLIHDMERLENSIFDSMLQNEDVRLVRAMDRYLNLLQTAYEIRMSTEEFKLYETNNPDFLTFPYLAFINRKLTELGYFEDLVVYKDCFEAGKKSLEDFYHSVSERDLAFINNAEKILDQEKPKVVVLITGGYHTEHLKELFKQKGYSYVVLTPNVSSETNRNKYEELLLAPLKNQPKEMSATKSNFEAETARPFALAMDGARLADFAVAAEIQDIKVLVGEFNSRPDNQPLESSGARLAKNKKLHIQQVLSNLEGGNYSLGDLSAFTGISQALLSYYRYKDLVEEENRQRVLAKAVKKPIEISKQDLSSERAQLRQAYEIFRKNPKHAPIRIKGVMPAMLIGGIGRLQYSTPIPGGGTLGKASPTGIGATPSNPIISASLEVGMEEKRFYIQLVDVIHEKTPTLKRDGPRLYWDDKTKDFKKNQIESSPATALRNAYEMMNQDPKHDPIRIEGILPELLNNGGAFKPVTPTPTPGGILEETTLSGLGAIPANPIISASLEVGMEANRLYIQLMDVVYQKTPNKKRSGFRLYWDEKNEVFKKDDLLPAVALKEAYEILKQNPEHNPIQVEKIIPALLRSNGQIHHSILAPDGKSVGKLMRTGIGSTPSNLLTSASLEVGMDGERLYIQLVDVAWEKAPSQKRDGPRLYWHAEERIFEKDEFPQITLLREAYEIFKNDPTHAPIQIENALPVLVNKKGEVPRPLPAPSGGIFSDGSPLGISGSKNRLAVASLEVGMEQEWLYIQLVDVVQESAPKQKRNGPRLYWDDKQKDFLSLEKFNSQALSLQPDEIGIHPAPDVEDVLQKGLKSSTQESKWPDFLHDPETYPGNEITIQGNKKSVIFHKRKESGILIWAYDTSDAGEVDSFYGARLSNTFRDKRKELENAFNVLSLDPQKTIRIDGAVPSLLRHNGQLSRLISAPNGGLYGKWASAGINNISSASLLVGKEGKRFYIQPVDVVQKNTPREKRNGAKLYWSPKEEDFKRDGVSQLTALKDLFQKTDADIVAIRINDAMPALVGAVGMFQTTFPNPDGGTLGKRNSFSGISGSKNHILSTSLLAGRAQGRFYIQLVDVVQQKSPDKKRDGPMLFWDADKKAFKEDQPEAVQITILKNFFKSSEQDISPIKIDNAVPLLVGYYGKLQISLPAPDGEPLGKVSAAGISGAKNPTVSASLLVGRESRRFFIQLVDVVQEKTPAQKRNGPKLYWNENERDFKEDGNEASEVAALRKIFKSTEGNILPFRIDNAVPVLVAADGKFQQSIPAPSGKSLGIQATTGLRAKPGNPILSASLIAGREEGIFYLQIVDVNQKLSIGKRDGPKLYWDINQQNFISLAKLNSQALSLQPDEIGIHPAPDVEDVLQKGLKSSTQESKWPDFLHDPETYPGNEITAEQDGGPVIFYKRKEGGVLIWGYKMKHIEEDLRLKGARLAIKDAAERAISTGIKDSKMAALWAAYETLKKNPTRVIRIDDVVPYLAGAHGPLQRALPVPGGGKLGQLSPSSISGVENLIVSASLEVGMEGKRLYIRMVDVIQEKNPSQKRNGPRLYWDAKKKDFKKDQTEPSAVTALREAYETLKKNPKHEPIIIEGVIPALAGSKLLLHQSLPVPSGGNLGEITSSGLASRSDLFISASLEVGMEGKRLYIRMVDVIQEKNPSQKRNGPRLYWDAKKKDFKKDQTEPSAVMALREAYETLELHPGHPPIRIEDVVPVLLMDNGQLRWSTPIPGGGSLGNQTRAGVGSYGNPIISSSMEVGAEGERFYIRFVDVIRTKTPYQKRNGPWFYWDPKEKDFKKEFILDVQPDEIGIHPAPDVEDVLQKGLKSSTQSSKWLGFLPDPETYPGNEVTVQENKKSVVFHKRKDNNILIWVYDMKDAENVWKLSKSYGARMASRESTNADYHARVYAEGSSRIVEALKSMEGKVNATNIGEKAKLFNSAVRKRDWRQMVADENKRRGNEEPNRKKLLIFGDGLTDVIRETLKGWEGKIFSYDLQKEFGISEPTVAKYDWRKLAKEENARRTTDEPDRNPLEIQIQPNMNAESTMRDALKAMNGLVTARALASKAGINESAVADHNYRGLISEENLRRKTHEPSRPELKFREERDMDSREKIITALRQMEGLVVPDDIVRIANLNDKSALVRHDYKTLVAEENARRAHEERGRPPLQTLEDKTGLAKGMIVRALRNMEGYVTREDIKTAAKVSDGPIDVYDYRLLIEEENTRRSSEEPDRSLLETAKPKIEDPDPIIREYLSAASGIVNMVPLAEKIGISTETLSKRLERLIDEENIRRQKEEPDRFLISLRENKDHYVAAIRHALKKFSGKITKNILASKTDYSVMFFGNNNLVALVDEENKRRAAQEPDRELIIYRSLNMDPAGSLNAALGRLEGTITVEDLIRESDVNQTTLKELNYRKLVEEENNRRKNLQPLRKPIVFSQKQPKENARQSIIEAIVKLEGPVSIKDLEREADVNYVTLYKYGIYDLIAQENGRRSQEEPQRPLLTVPSAHKFTYSNFILDLQHDEIGIHPAPDVEDVLQKGLKSSTQESKWPDFLPDPETYLGYEVTAEQDGKPVTFYKRKDGGILIWAYTIPESGARLSRAEAVSKKLAVAYSTFDKIRPGMSLFINDVEALVDAEETLRLPLPDGRILEQKIPEFARGSLAALSLVLVMRAEDQEKITHFIFHYTLKNKKQEDLVFYWDKQKSELLPVGSTLQKPSRKKPATKAEQAIDLFKKYKLLDLAVSLSSNPEEMQQALMILLTHQGVQMDETEFRDLSRAFLLNLGEGSEGSSGGGSVAPPDFMEYLRALMALRAEVDALDENERFILIRAFIRISFPKFARDFEATMQEMKSTIAQAQADSPFLNDLTRYVEMDLKTALSFQPAHLRTQLLPHQRFGAWMMRESEKYQAEGIFGFLLEDDTRLGKTIQAYAAMDPTWKAAVIVPASVMDTWQEQFYQHTDGRMKFVMVRGTAEEKARLIEENKDQKGVILLMSIEDLGGRSNEEIAWINQGLDVMVIDEGQKIENYGGQALKTSTLQARAIHKLKTARHWVLSASPYTSHPRQLFSVFNLIHTDPSTGKVTNPMYTSRREFNKLLTGDLVQMRWLYALKARIGLRRTKAEMGLLYSKKREVDWKEEGSYEASMEQSHLVLRIIKNLGQYLKLYNARVKPEYRVHERSISVFLKLQFLTWALTEPRILGETLPTTYWDEMDKIVEKRLAAGKKGIIFAQNTAIINEIIRRYEERGLKVARIDGEVTGRAIVNGKPVLDERGHPVSAQAYQRHLFQTDPDVKLVVMNIRAGVGLDVSSAEWELFAQLPQHYVEYYQSSDRALGLNRAGKQKEVEVLFMVPQYPAAFVEQVFKTSDRLYVEHGTPAEILYQGIMGEDKARFELVMEGIQAEQGMTEHRALTRLVHAVRGFLEDPSMKRPPKEKKAMEVTSALYPLYRRLEGDAKRQDEVLSLVDFFLKTEISPAPFAQAVAGRETFDPEDLQWINALVDTPSKYQRDLLLGMVPDLLKQVWAQQQGINELVKRGPPALQSLASTQPELVVPFIAATHGWSVASNSEEELEPRHLGAVVLLEILEEFYTDGFSDYDRSQWVKRYVHALVNLIDLNDARFLDFVARLQPDLLSDNFSLEEKVSLFEELGVLRFADKAAFESIIQSAGNLESVKRRLREEIRTSVISLFDLPDSDAVHRRLAELARDWGSLNDPVRLMTKLLDGGPNYSEHVRLFKQIFRHIVDGDYSQWRNRQTSDPTGHEIPYRSADLPFWEAFTREERVALGDVRVSSTALKKVRKKHAEGLLGLLQNKADLNEAFGPLGKKIQPDLSRPNSESALMEEKAVKGRQRHQLEIEKKKGVNLDKAIEVLNLELREINSRLQVVHLAEALKGEDVAQIRKAVHDVEKIVLEPPKGLEDIGLHIRTALRELRESLNQEESREFPDVEVQITSDPDLIMRRGMLHEELKNCFNLEGGVKQIATLLDDLASRNKMLAIVRSKDRIVSIAIVKVRKTSDEKPVLMIERPLYRWGYDFQREIVNALVRTKLPDMKGVAIAGDSYKTEAKQYRQVTVYGTGTRAPEEYYETLWGIRLRAANVSHVAGILVEAGARLASKRSDEAEGVSRRHFLRVAFLSAMGRNLNLGSLPEAASKHFSPDLYPHLEIRSERGLYFLNWVAKEFGLQGVPYYEWDSYIEDKGMSGSQRQYWESYGGSQQVIANEIIGRGGEPFQSKMSEYFLSGPTGTENDLGIDDLLDTMADNLRYMFGGEPVSEGQAQTLLEWLNNTDPKFISDNLLEESDSDLFDSDMTGKDNRNIEGEDQRVSAERPQVSNDPYDQFLLSVWEDEGGASLDDQGARLARSKGPADFGQQDLFNDGDSGAAEERKEGISRIKISLDGIERDVLGIGHSNRTAEQFIDLLKKAGVKTLIDVRTRPLSRFNPHFNRNALTAALKVNGIEYIWQGDKLGGKLPELEGDFQKYMELDPDKRFTRGMLELLQNIRMKPGPIALLCSEKAVADCHRQFILNFLSLLDTVAFLEKNKNLQGARLSSRNETIMKVTALYDKVLKAEPGEPSGAIDIGLLVYLQKNALLSKAFPLPDGSKVDKPVPTRAGQNVRSIFLRLQKKEDGHLWFMFDYVKTDGSTGTSEMMWDEEKAMLIASQDLFNQRMNEIYKKTTELEPGEPTEPVNIDQVVDLKRGKLANAFPLPNGRNLATQLPFDAGRDLRAVFLRLQKKADGRLWLIFEFTKEGAAPASSEMMWDEENHTLITSQDLLIRHLKKSYQSILSSEPGEWTEAILVDELMLKERATGLLDGVLLDVFPVPNGQKLGYPASVGSGSGTKSISLRLQKRQDGQLWFMFEFTKGDGSSGTSEMVWDEASKKLIQKTIVKNKVAKGPKADTIRQIRAHYQILMASEPGESTESLDVSGLVTMIHGQLAWSFPLPNGEQLGNGTRPAIGSGTFYHLSKVSLRLQKRTDGHLWFMFDYVKTDGSTGTSEMMWDEKPQTLLKPQDLLIRQLSETYERLLKSESGEPTSPIALGEELVSMNEGRLRMIFPLPNGKKLGSQMRLSSDSLQSVSLSLQKRQDGHLWLIFDLIKKDGSTRRKEMFWDEARETLNRASEDVSALLSHELGIHPIPDIDTVSDVGLKKSLKKSKWPDFLPDPETYEGNEYIAKKGDVAVSFHKREESGILVWAYDIADAENVDKLNGARLANGNDEILVNRRRFLQFSASVAAVGEDGVIRVITALPSETIQVPKNEYSELLFAYLRPDRLAFLESFESWWMQAFYRGVSDDEMPRRTVLYEMFKDMNAYLEKDPGLSVIPSEEELNQLLSFLKSKDPETLSKDPTVVRHLARSEGWAQMSPEARAAKAVRFVAEFRRSVQGVLGGVRALRNKILPAGEQKYDDLLDVIPTLRRVLEEGPTILKADPWFQWARQSEKRGMIPSFRDYLSRPGATPDEKERLREWRERLDKRILENERREEEVRSRAGTDAETPREREAREWKEEVRKEHTDDAYEHGRLDAWENEGGAAQRFLPNENHFASEEVTSKQINNLPETEKELIESLAASIGDIPLRSFDGQFFTPFELRIKGLKFLSQIRLEKTNSGADVYFFNVSGREISVYSVSTEQIYKIKMTSKTPEEIVAENPQALKIISVRHEKDRLDRFAFEKVLPFLLQTGRKVVVQYPVEANFRNSVELYDQFTRNIQPVRAAQAKVVEEGGEQQIFIQFVDSNGQLAAGYKSDPVTDKNIPRMSVTVPSPGQITLAQEMGFGIVPIEEWDGVNEHILFRPDLPTLVLTIGAGLLKTQGQAVVASSDELGLLAQLQAQLVDFGSRPQVLEAGSRLANFQAMRFPDATKKLLLEGLRVVALAKVNFDEFIQLAGTRLAAVSRSA